MELPESAVLSSPAVADGVVYVGADDDNLYAINASTGVLLWSYKTGDSILSLLRWRMVWCMSDPPMTACTPSTCPGSEIVFDNQAIARKTRPCRPYGARIILVSEGDAGLKASSPHHRTLNKKRELCPRLSLPYRTLTATSCGLCCGEPEPLSKPGCRSCPAERRP